MRIRELEVLSLELGTNVVSAMLSESHLFAEEYISARAASVLPYHMVGKIVIPSEPLEYGRVWPYRVKGISKTGRFIVDRVSKKKRKLEAAYKQAIPIDSGLVSW